MIKAEQNETFQGQADAAAKETPENPSQEPSQAARCFIRVREHRKEFHIKLIIKSWLENAMQMVRDVCEETMEA